MEYEVKKKEILDQVQYTNLLSFSLVENKLQRNFRNIVEALMLNQTKTDEINDEHLQVKEQHSKEINKLNDLVKQIKQKLQNIHNQQKNTESNNPPHSVVRLQSIKQIERLPSRKILQRISTPPEDSHNIKHIVDNLNQKVNGWQNKWDNEKADLMKEINNLKDKLDEVGFFQSQLKNLQNDFKTMKDQVSSGLKNNNTNSHKTLSKRSSLLNLMNNKASEKIVQQPSRNSIKIMSKDDNKENSPNVLTDNTSEENQQNSVNQMVQKEINSLYLEFNTMKISFEELKDLVSDNRKHLFKNNNLFAQVKEDLARQVKTRKGQTEDLQKAIKDIKMQLLNNQNTTNLPPIQSQEKGLRESAKTAKGAKKDDDDINYKNHLNDKISRMQAMIQNLITQSEFNRLKNDLNDQLEKLSSKIDSVEGNLEDTQKKLQDLIVQNQVNTNSELDDLKSRMTLSEDNSKNQANQNERKNNILNAKIQEVKKSLQNLREDLEFYQSMMTENNKNSLKQDNQSQEISNQNDRPKVTVGVDQKALEALKKYFSGKMHDMRTNLLGLIRDLEKKMNNKSSGDQQVVKIWDRLNEFNLFLNKKADQDDSKKTFFYLEKQINRLNSALFKSQENTEDARIVRSNQWNCLSCDKNLNNYQGKIGKHIVWDSMPLKGINKSGMVQQDEKKKGLPLLKK